MAALTLQHISDAGTKPTFGAASVSDTALIGNGLNTFLVYKNGSGSPVDVTVVAPGDTDYGVALPDKVVTVAAAGEAWIPLRKSYDDASGSATVTMADATGVTVALVRLG
ncbi:hypothetical protein SEA_SHAGRAT_15 [Rhodococcus phage Shagrat]|nr:hypothetical protein SEA_SHAGRAT_15 [Rhodococcus phage Shagrat]